MGQWQVSITSTPPSSTLTLCSSRSKALAAFFCLPSSGGGPPRLYAQLECTYPKEGWENSRDNEGAESCVRGECPVWHRDMKPPLYAVPPCPSHEPSPGPVSSFPLWNQTLQSRERKSTVRNNLTVCHRGMPLPTRAQEVCSRVYSSLESASVSVSVSAIGVFGVHVFEGRKLFAVGFFPWTSGRKARLTYYQGKKPRWSPAGLFPSARVCAQLACICGYWQQWVARIIKPWSYSHSR